MNQRRHLALVAGAATVLTASGLAGVFEQWTFFPYVLTVVAAVVGGAAAARAMRMPVWVQPLAGLAALALYVTVVFGQGSGLLGIVPTVGTLESLVSQAEGGFTDIVELAAPVPDRRGLLLLTVLGLGLVAVVVDLIAVGLGRAALAGLPLLAVHAVPVAVDRDGLPWPAFAAAAAGYLWLLVADQVVHLRRWGRPFRADNPSRRFAPDVPDIEGNALASSGRRIGLAGIAVAVLIPLIMPGFSSVSGFGLSSGEGWGFGGSRSVTTVNPLTQLAGRLTRGADVELMEVRTTDSEPGYLRLTTLNTFTGAGWTQAQIRAGRDARVADRTIPQPDLEGEFLRFQTEVSVTRRMEDRYLPIYPFPRSIDADGDWRYEGVSGTVFSSRTNTRELDYDFVSYRVNPTAEQLRESQELPEDSPLRTRFTAVTNAGPVPPQVTDILNGLVKPTDTPYDRVLAINNFFSEENDFSYNEEVPQGTNKNALANFLEQKQGFCQQFASAMAYLVRAAGVPARVAVGFSRGESLGDKTWSISAHDAHAWVEVYFAGFGWVPFDPTPASGVTGAVNLGYDDPAPVAPGDPGTPGPSATPSPGSTAGENDPDIEVKPGENTQLPGAAGSNDQDPPVPQWAWYALGFLGLLLVAAVPAMMRMRVRRRRFRLMAGPDPVAAAHAAWDEALDLLTDLGQPVSDSETPRRTAVRLARSGGFDEQGKRAVRLLGQAEEMARYAPEAMSQPALVDAVRTLHRLQSERVERSVRLRARLLPASARARIASWWRARDEELTDRAERTSWAITRRLRRLIPRLPRRAAG